MKRKNIKSVIHSKINDWLKSIKDENVKELARANVIVTGGSIASMLLNEKVNDFDIYFRTREATLAVASYYIRRFLENPPVKFKTHDGIVPIYIDPNCDNAVKIVIKSAGAAGENGSDKYEYFESDPDPDGVRAAQFIEEIVTIADESVTKEKDNKPKYRPVFLSSNAITLSDQIQIVTRFYGEPNEIHENYDFLHCCNYWTGWNNELVLRPESLEALLAKELVYVGSKYPICSIFRLRKFIDRGWHISAGQIFKICYQISKLNLNDIHVLEDQLTGVDTAYFQQILTILKERDPNNIDTAYLMQLIDRFF